MFSDQRVSIAQKGFGLPALNSKGVGTTQKLKFGGASTQVHWRVVGSVRTDTRASLGGACSFEPL